MAEKLKSLLTERTLWRLLLKTAIAVLAIGLIGPIGPIGLIIAFVVFAVIYFREIEEKRFFRVSFWLLPVLTLVAINPIGPISPIGPIVVFAVLFFVLLGLVNLFFKERFLTYGIFNTAFLTGVSLFYFYIAREPGNFWIFGTLFFIVVFLILKENFGFMGFPGGRRINLYAGVLGFLGVELAYVLQFLPLGFINAAVYLSLFLVLGRDTIVSSAKGALNFSFMMKQIAIFAVLSIVVLAASDW